MSVGAIMRCQGAVWKCSFSACGRRWLVIAFCKTRMEKSHDMGRPQVEDQHQSPELDVSRSREPMLWLEEVEHQTGRSILDWLQRSGAVVRGELQWSSQDVTSAWMSTLAASVLRKGWILLMLHRRNLQERTTMFLRCSRSHNHLLPWWNQLALTRKTATNSYACCKLANSSGLSNYQSAINLLSCLGMRTCWKEHKLSLVQFELWVVPWKGLLILFPEHECVLGDLFQ